MFFYLFFIFSNVKEAILSSTCTYVYFGHLVMHIELLKLKSEQRRYDNKIVYIYVGECINTLMWNHVVLAL